MRSPTRIASTPSVTTATAGDTWCASNGGAPRNPDWYYNLKAHPNVTIEVETDTIPAQASEASGEEHDRVFRTSVDRAPQLGEYAKQAGRTIPVIVLTPTETG